MHKIVVFRFRPNQPVDFGDFTSDYFSSAIEISELNALSPLPSYFSYVQHPSSSVATAVLELTGPLAMMPTVDLQLRVKQGINILLDVAVYNLQPQTVSALPARARLPKSQPHKPRKQRDRWRAVPTACR